MEGAQISLTLIIIIFTCIISYQGFNNQQMRNDFLMRPASVKEFGQYYRFLSSGFLHGSWIHLGINMFVLYQFGEQLEFTLLQHFGGLAGRLFFLLIYLGSIIFGALPSFIKHSNNQYYSALGASGGVAGVLFACSFLYPWSILLLYFVLPIPYIIAGILYLFYESYMDKKGGDNVAHDAHMSGAVFGYISIIIIFLIMNPNLFQAYLHRLLSGPFG
ncbi:MAG: rhomboid family intramembrane serine protease [Saprospiraceae bacterium]|nr:rhomboid family intramembrane serine protease [Saprospiraceae bacterium]